MTAAQPTPARADAPTDRRRLLAAHEAATVFYRHHLTRPDAPHGPRRYFDNRGLGLLIDRELPWRIGYAPTGWTTLTDHLRTAGFTDQELLTAGLSTLTRDNRLIDVFRDRITFPIHDAAGNVLAFIGRAPPTAAKTVPKYVNSPQTPLYTKGDHLYGAGAQHDRLAAGWPPVLVEGPTDVIAVWLAHPRSYGTGAVAVAPCGTALTEAQAATLRKVPGAAHGIVVALDADPAGQRALEHAWRLLRSTRSIGPVRTTEFPPGTDPASLLGQPTGRAALRAALRRTRPALETIIDDRFTRLTTKYPRLLEDIGGRLAAARSLTPWIFEAENQPEAIRLAAHLADRTGIGLGLLTLVAFSHVESTVEQAQAELDRHSSASTHRPPVAMQAFTRPMTVMPATASNPPGRATPPTQTSGRTVAARR